MEGLNGAVKAYLRRMLADCGTGMKALVLDQTTVRLQPRTCLARVASLPVRPRTRLARVAALHVRSRTRVPLRCPCPADLRVPRVLLLLAEQC